MTKPISAMTPEEIAAIMGTEKTAEQRYREEYGGPDRGGEDDVPLKEPAWHQQYKPREQFLSSLSRKPKKGILGILSKDDPNELSKYPKNVKIQGKPQLSPDDPLFEPPDTETIPDYDINRPREVFRSSPPTRDRSLLHTAATVTLWTLHVVFMIGTLYLTYYMITQVRSPGITDFAAVGSLAVIISLQVSLFSINTVLGTVIRR